MWTIQFPRLPCFHCSDTEPSFALRASEMIDGFFIYLHQLNVMWPVAYITAITGPAMCSPISYSAHTVRATAHHGFDSAFFPNHMKNFPWARPIAFANLTIILNFLIARSSERSNVVSLAHATLVPKAVWKISLYHSEYTWSYHHCQPPSIL